MALPMEELPSIVQIIMRQSMGMVMMSFMMTVQTLS